MKNDLTINAFSLLMISSMAGNQNQNDSYSKEPINLTDIGFMKSSIKTSLGEMSVFETREGKPLLLLHGVRAGASSFLWFKIAPKLAKKYRLIAPDIIGWGESHHPEKDLLFDDYVQQIKELSKWIGEPVTIVTQSLSCGFTLAAIQKVRIQVNKVALFTPSGGFDFGVDTFGEQETAYFKQIANSSQSLQFYEQSFHQNPAVENWWRNVGFLNGKNVPEEVIESNFYNAKLPNASYSALPFLSGALRYEIAPFFANVKVPAIMDWGADEFRIQATIRERISEINSSIDVFEIENARSAFEVGQPGKTLITFFKN